MPDTNLTNPHIIDQVESVTDISGRTIKFFYTTQGLMAKMVDGYGDPQTTPKTFGFTYDATQGNKNVKLVKVTDPRGHDTSLDYYYPQTGDDPQFHWHLKTITDRLIHDTGFAYTDPDGSTGSTIQTVVTDPETNQSKYLMDGFGRPTTLTNAKQQVTTLDWDADNNVKQLTEPPATTGATPAVFTWTYDPLTGYPTESKDAEANKNQTAGTIFYYQSGMNGHIADLKSKTSPEGRVYSFGYDEFGNLQTVTDPDGNATSTDGDYTTTYGYDAFGQPATAEDANHHTTQYLGYDDNGYPTTIKDPLNNSTLFDYDERGQVKTVTDPAGGTTSQNYDVFGRPTDKTVSKDHTAGTYITTPAPVYDANDNVRQATAPNGAVTTAIYDDADQLSSTTAPPDTDTSPERKTAYEYDTVGNVTKVTQPKGTLTATDDTDYVTTYGYNEIYEQTSVTDANGDLLTYDYDDAGNVTKVTDPRKNATADTTDYTTKYTYDLNHRVTAVTDADNHTTQTGYDRDGLKTSTTDQDGNKTIITPDPRGDVTQVQVPHSDSGGSITYDTAQYVYDQVGNRTKVITPRGVATTGVADDFIAQTDYDELNRVKQKLTPYDPNDPRYNHPDATIYTYDNAGHLQKVSAPPSEGQTVRNDTIYTYFDNGWTRTSTDPWDIATSYDYNELGQQTSRTLTPGGESPGSSTASRTMGWTYYPDGKLKTRTDDGVPVGKQIVLVDDSDIQNTGYTGTAWTSASSGTGYQGYDYATHTAGTGSNSFSWNLTIPEDGTYQVYAKNPTVSGAASNATYTVHDGTGATTTHTVDQTTGDGSWVSLGSANFTRDGTGQQITLSDNANGTVVADAVKLVRDNSADVDNEKADFAYAYDPNGNLTDITDNSPGTKIDDYTVTYNGLNQVSQVEEKNAGIVKHTTTYTYNENGEPATRGHDDESATYTYDDRDLLSTVSDQASPTDTAKVTTFTYTSRGQRDIETKNNGNTVDADYYLDGLLQHQVEKKPNGTIVSEHTYTYDPNGNKSQDVASTMNADDHAAYLNTTTNYTYDPLDRIAQVTKTGASTDTETYAHDPNNNVVSQTIKGTTTTYNYDRNRLLTSVTGGVTSDYNYDPFGRLDTVTSAGSVIERETYDGFDRIAENEKQNSAGSLVATKYIYDPLDRTTSKTTDPGGVNEKTTNYSYLGLSDQVLDEDVAGQITKSYQYSPWGERLSQVKTNTDGSKEDAYYGYNDHTDVETLTDSGGDTKATYGYTAYGQSDDAETTGIDKPDPADPTKEPYNAYRYEAKRWDSNSGTYDMGFRDYSPGLNQFLARDTYNGALDDQNLATDPFTANRYAFSGGNPIGTVEEDGHEPCPSGKNCDYLYTGDPGKTDQAKATRQSLLDTARDKWTNNGQAFQRRPKAGSPGFALYNYCGAKFGRIYPNNVGRVCTAMLEHGESEQLARYFTQHPEEFLPSDKAGDIVLPWKESKLEQTADAIEGAASFLVLGAVAGEAKAAGCVNSFTSGTKVLLANGKTKPIEKVKIGDKVKATDPKTGKTTIKKVTASFGGTRYDHLVQITIDTDGKHGHHTGTITATEHHKFWNPTKHAWIRADQLTPGATLRTPGGEAVPVLHAYYAFGHSAVHDLTIADLHTYYVEAGTTPVLVHNSSGPCDVPLKPLHPYSSLKKSSLDFWGKQDTSDIVHSLRPGAREPLIVKPDGTIMNGNTRVEVLRSRGYDVNSLPRETYGGKTMTDEDFWDMDQ